MGEPNDVCLATLGHPDGGDDAAALEVAHALEAELPCFQLFDALQLIDLASHTRVFVVDATRDLPKGRALVFEASDECEYEITDPSTVSSHGFGVDRAIRLARALGSATRFTIVAVGAGGEGSTKESIAAAVGAIRDALAAH